MKTVMVVIHDDAGQEARLQCALDVVRAVEGHLLCLDVVRLPVVADGFGVGTASAMLIVDEREREDTNIDRLEPRLVTEGVSHEWARVLSNSDSAITDAARLVDLIVVGRRGIGDLAETGDMAARLAELTRAPILLVPTEQKSINLSGKALVTWDGSAPSGAAIRAAAPLLRLADVVEVLTIGEGNEDADPDEAAVYLARHGCRTTARREPKSGDAGAQLLDEIGKSRADWCVMGSYGHSRLREQLFGGSSKTLFAKAPVPLLLAH
ncbi:MAG: universal stress protein [Sphingobium sp.]|nr:universal stress protein [Sphingobium sp.]